MDEQEEPKMREYCVTGGTGLIGSYLVKSLLDKGYNVRTTVRNPGMYVLYIMHNV